MIYSNLFFLACMIGMVCGFHIQIRHEEAFLAEAYGRHYHEYKMQVRRYI